MIIDHHHEWHMFGTVTKHFEDVPNSKQKHRHVQRVVCLMCGQKGFRYLGLHVVYTWSPADVDAA